MITERKNNATDLTSLQNINMVRLSMHFDKNVLRKKLKNTEIRRLVRRYTAHVERKSKFGCINNRCDWENLEDVAEMFRIYSAEHFRTKCRRGPL